MGVDSEVYRLVLVVHIAAAVVGFGAIALNGMYASQAHRRGGAEGAAIGEANRAATRGAALFSRSCCTSSPPGCSARW